MPFRDPQTVLILGFIGEFPPATDVPYVDIGDVAKGRLYIYYDSGSLNIISEYWIGQENVDIEQGPASIETDPATIIARNFTGAGSPGFTLDSGEFNNRGDASVWLFGRVGAASDAANTSTDTPRIEFSGRYLVFKQQDETGFTWGGDTFPMCLVDDVKVTTSSGTFTTTETVVITLSNVPVLNGNKYRIKAIATFASTVAGDDITVRIREDSVSGTVLQTHEDDIISTTIQRTVTIETEFICAANDVTKDFVLTCVRTGGAGNINLQASATQPAFMYAEGPYR
jgi:hypothetical protein